MPALIYGTIHIEVSLLSQLRKLLDRIKNNPKQVKFQELDKVLIRSGFNKRQPRGGSSHYIYSKGFQRLVVPHRQPYIKAVYVEKAIKILEGESDND